MEKKSAETDFFLSTQIHWKLELILNSETPEILQLPVNHPNHSLLTPSLHMYLLMSLHMNITEKCQGRFVSIAICGRRTLSLKMREFTIHTVLLLGSTGASERKIPLSST